MTELQKWIPCNTPQIGETLKWNEPLWAAPNKPRGKRDKIGEQEIIAELISMQDFLEFTVISVKKLSGDNASLQVCEGDKIRRKSSTLKLGECQKAIG